MQAATIAEAFRITAEEHADVLAVRTRDDAIAWTWGELRERVDALAGGLARLGVKRGDTVALMLLNRPEFHVADLAAMTLGATPFSIYLTSSPEQIAYVLRDAAPRVAIVEPRFVEPVSALVEHVIDVEALDALAEPGFDSEPHWRAVAPDDVLTLIYTSGTTGPPKGVQLLHRNQIAAVQAVEERVGFGPGFRVISWLPSAHVAERTAHHYLPIAYGMTITTCPDPRRIAEWLPAVRPSWFFAVPRVWEKLKAGVEAKLGEPESALIEAGKRRVELEQAGEPVPEDLAATCAVAEAKLFAPLRAAIGLDQASLVNVGAAPTPRDVFVFFHAIGIPLAEIWGMSETCGAGCSNPGDRIRIGTVGLPSPGVEVKLAQDGELLVRSPVVMSGYRNLPERTAEALDADGWLHTGDVAEIDADGYVRIVDRKKELIIDAGGKNMSPANIEAAVKGASPLIGQACVIGDGRPFVTALIVLDADYAPAWAARAGVAGDLEELARDERVRAAVQEGVDAANATLARPEQVKRFTLVEGDWLPGGDELTPTMKLKRRPIGEKYAAAIAAMYS
jgi:long-subunit acyl-CoA synthetase (AMP-forming)